MLTCSISTFKDEKLLARLNDFYNLEENCRLFFKWHPKGRGTISCRMMEYFVNVFTVSHNVKCQALSTTPSSVSSISSEMTSNVYTEFINARKKWHVRRFDPLARGHKVTLNYKQYSIQSSIAQLNFFIWAITCNVFNQLYQIRDEVARDLAKYNEMKRTTSTQNRNCLTNKNNHTHTPQSKFEKNGCPRDIKSRKRTGSGTPGVKREKEKKETFNSSMAQKLSPKDGNDFFRLV